MLNFTLFERLFNQITTLREKKSIQEVIQWGQILINIPAVAIAFSLVIFAFNFEELFLDEPFDLHIIWRGLILLFAFIIGIILSWLYWSFTIPKWRVWAYKNVPKNEWEDLMWAAVDAKLIWTPGHVFEETEMRDEEATEKTALFYEHISAKMRREQALGSYSDDENVPAETKYFLSKKDSWVEAIAIVFIALIGFANIIFGTQIFFKLLGTGIVAYLIYDLRDSPLRDLLKEKEAQIILNEKGIGIKKQEMTFYPWQRVNYMKWEEEKEAILVVVENEDQKIEEFSEILIKLELLNVSHREFLKTTQVYMGRFDRNNLAPLN